MSQRIITAIIAALIFIPIVFIGGIPFIILIYMMATLCLFEIFRMKKIKFNSFAGIISTILLWVFLLPTNDVYFFNGIELDAKIALFFFGVLLFLCYSFVSKNSFSFDTIGFCVLAILYIGIGFYYIIETRNIGGVLLFFFALFLIWATDSGAYFVGRAVGKRKLAPHISPNKTIEGSIGGIVSAVVVALLFYFLSDIQESFEFVEILITSIVLSIFGQFGDLVESGLKRFYNVKDSGKILPGHGGMLDRVDSWLFVMPLLNFLQLL
ncbi:phosphatidate cytidylyltransferase [Bacillus andreraoultii]|uniref:phosphatidate cytidylyltransferase n=1 Tax=Bacillus andreraoultii TaxID=1499685 RepID=UPI00053B3A24|nr:phosphatidate cytidylyltransferase [Bacillus andreraoultii]